MKLEDTIRIAIKAGILWSPDQAEVLEHFRRLAAEEEREECAKVCEELKSNWSYCAEAIRSRK